MPVMTGPEIGAAAVAADHPATAMVGRKSAGAATDTRSAEFAANTTAAEAASYVAAAATEAATHVAAAATTTTRQSVGRYGSGPKGDSRRQDDCSV
jgi:hypothetical protein